MTLLVDYNNPNRWVLGAYGSVYFTSNGGTSYTTLSPSNAYMAGAWFDGTKIYIATASGIMVSTNNGASFRQRHLDRHRQAGEGIVSFAAAKTSAAPRVSSS